MRDTNTIRRQRFVDVDGPTTVSIGPDDLLAIDEEDRVLLNGEITGVWLEEAQTWEPEKQK